jgi:hypothetical protein
MEEFFLATILTAYSRSKNIGKNHEGSVGLTWFKSSAHVSNTAGRAK